MSKDKTGKLKELVDNFIKEDSREKRMNMLDDIIYKWAEVENTDPKIRGEYFDARKLEVIEKITGQIFNGASGKNPIREAADPLNNTYNLFKDKVYGALMHQTRLAPLFSGVKVVIDVEKSNFAYDEDEIINKLQVELDKDESYGKELLLDIVKIDRTSSILSKESFMEFKQYFTSKSSEYEFIINLGEVYKIIYYNKDIQIPMSGENYAVVSSTGDDVIKTGSGNNVIYTGAGNDKIESNYGDDIIYSGKGNDTINAGYGNDILDGQEGNDYLEGGSGNDTYIFGKGYGVDTIYDCDYTSGNVDKIKFKEGITKEDVILKRIDDKLELSIKNSEDKIIVENYFHGLNFYKIEEVEFADGFKWSVDDIKKILIQGGKGNDKIIGYEGNDILDGQEGNDYLEGGSGNDTYIFGKGYGVDTIYDCDYTSGNKYKVIFGEKILNTIFEKDGNNLKINFVNSSDTLNINNWYSGSSYQIEEFKSSDSKNISNTQVQLLIDAMASFTTEKGISWNNAIKEKPNEVDSILTQFWTNQSA